MTNSGGTHETSPAACRRGPGTGRYVLEALQKNPEAFGSTFEKESGAAAVMVRGGHSPRGDFWRVPRRDGLWEIAGFAATGGREARA